MRQPDSSAHSNPQHADARLRVPRRNPEAAHRSVRRDDQKFTHPLPNDMADHGGHILGLDGLRALAVGAVVLYHVFPSVFRGGFLGVDLFFVISGFLITTLLLREDRRNNFIDLKGFWTRRIRRLIPALVMLILLVVPAAWIVNSDLLVGMRRQVLGALTFSTNWLEIVHGSNYFDQTSPVLFKNLWSLAIEEQFYLFWPLIFLAVLVILPTWWQKATFAGVLGLGSAGLMAALYNGENLTRLYYGTDTHLFGLAIGIVLAFLWSDPESRVLGSHHWRTFSGAYGWAALLGVIVAMFVMPDQGPWAYMGGMFGVSLLAGIVIAAMLKPGSIMARIGQMKAFHWIGTRSYGIYLWHWPVIVIAAALVPTAVGTSAYVLRSVIAVVVSGLLAEMSFRLLETPIRKRGFKEFFAAANEQLASGSTLSRSVLGAVGILLLATAGGLIVAPAESATTRQIKEAQAEIDAQASKDAQETDSAPHKTTTPETTKAPASKDPQATSAAPEESDGATEPKETPTEGVAGDISPNLDPSMPSNEEVTAIGDSMIVASKTGLEAAMPGMNFVAKSNLKWSEAPGIVEEALNNGSIGRVVVIDFGTNAGVPNPDDVRTTLDLLGEDRMIVLVNLYSPSTFIQDSNQKLEQIASEYPNVHLADWHAVVRNAPELLQVDQTHTSIAGANAFGEFAKDSIAELSATLTKKLDSESTQ